MNWISSMCSNSAVKPSLEWEESPHCTWSQTYFTPTRVHVVYQTDIFAWSTVSLSSEAHLALAKSIMERACGQIMERVLSVADCRFSFAQKILHLFSKYFLPVWIFESIMCYVKQVFCINLKDSSLQCSSNKCVMELQGNSKWNIEAENCYNWVLALRGRWLKLKCDALEMTVL